MISEICLKKGPTNVNRSQDNDFLCLSNIEIQNLDLNSFEFFQFVFCHVNVGRYSYIYNYSTS